MRLIFSLLLFPFCSLAQNVSLSWQYSSNSLALADSNGWPHTFKIYSAAQATAPLPWTNVYSQAASNTPIIGFDGVNYTYSITNPVAPGQAYYYATISNIWGESGPSNTSSVPALPLTLHTKILKD